MGRAKRERKKMNANKPKVRNESNSSNINSSNSSNSSNSNSNNNQSNIYDNNQLNVLSFVRNNLLNNWKEFFDRLKYNAIESQQDYMCMHCLCNVKDIPFFRLAQPPVEYITLCLIYVNNYPDNIYLYFSDHKKGIYERAAKDKGCYFCLEQNLIIGKHIDDVKCYIDVEPLYLKYDFLTGKPTGEQSKKLKKYFE